MIVVNRDGLKAEYRNTIGYMEKLEGFLQDVALAKPLLSFSVDDLCVTNERKKDANGDIKNEKMLYCIKVYGAGEELGSIGIVDRWRGGITEKAYMVECFRINKHRGRGNTTTSIDVKLALREAKKAFNPREDSELKHLIRDWVTQQVSNTFNAYRNNLRWDLNQEDELCNYALAAYEARKSGEAYAKLPSAIASVKDVKAHDKKCEKFIHYRELFDALSSKQGFGIRANLDNSIIVYSYMNDSITRFNSFTDLPDSIQSKYAIFKVLDELDAVGGIGVKFSDGYAYIMP
jgi:hypothetical protein